MPGERRLEAGETRLTVMLPEEAQGTVWCSMMESVLAELNCLDETLRGWRQHNCHDPPPRVATRVTHVAGVVRVARVARVRRSHGDIVYGEGERKGEADGDVRGPFRSRRRLFCCSLTRPVVELRCRCKFSE